MKKLFLFLSIITVFLTSCSNNYSNGERIGTVNKLSKKGIVWDSHEGHLNVTQTGMTSTDGFDFSIDNDNEPVGLVDKLDSAAQYGWKVKLIYHQVAGFNLLSNRGETDYFVTDMEVLDRNFSNSFTSKGIPNGNQNSTGGIHDTVYVVIVPKEKIKW